MVVGQRNSTMASLIDANQVLADLYNIRGGSPRFIKGTRWHDLPRIFKECGFKVGAEIGVELGKFSECLARKVPCEKLYCIDPWVTYGDQFTRHNPDEFYDLALEKLNKYDCVEIIRKFSMEAVKDFEDESLDFVYIDGNHDFPHVTEDINAWSKKVRKGGIISGHDYVFERSIGAHAGYVVRDWTDIYKIKPWYVIDESKKVGHGRPSWLWVK